MVVVGKSPHGGDIYTNKVKYDFSANINPLGLPKEIINEYLNCTPYLDKYPDPYCGALREAISLKDKVPYDNIICGNGAADIIYSYFSLFMNKKALIIGPTFSEYEQALATNCVKFDYYLVKEENNFKLNDELINYLKNNQYDLIIICNPNNPTGVLTHNKLLLEMLKLNINLFVDECFMDFVKDNDNYSLIRYLNKYPNLFILKAFTKIYAMAGIRLGYGITSNKETLKEMSSNTQAWNVSVVAQRCGVVACTLNDYIIKSLDYIEEQRNYLMNNLTRLGFKCYESHVNFIFFKGPKELDTKLKEKGILIRNCSNYISLDISKDYSYYRIAVRREEENKELIKMVKEIIHG